MAKGNPIEATKLEYIWQQAKASSEKVGHIVTEEDENIIKAILKGNISRDLLMDIIKETKDTTSKINIDSILKKQIEIIHDFILHYTTFKCLNEKFDELCKLGNQVYWVYTINAHYYQSINLWCMVFGNRSESTHWNKLNASEQLTDYVLSKTDKTTKEYNSYWKEIIIWRNKFSAHRDVRVTEIPSTPDLKMALIVVYCYEEWIEAFLNVVNEKPFKWYKDVYEEDVNLFINNIIKNKHEQHYKFL